MNRVSCCVAYREPVTSCFRLRHHCVCNPSASLLLHSYPGPLPSRCTHACDSRTLCRPWLTSCVNSVHTVMPSFCFSSWASRTLACSVSRISRMSSSNCRGRQRDVTHRQIAEGARTQIADRYTTPASLTRVRHRDIKSTAAVLLVTGMT